MKTVLLTGATGFLGSHIAEELVKRGFKVVCLKRNTSNTWRCKAFTHLLHWLSYENINDITSNIIEHNPDILIHAAWNGVKAADRDDWDEQEKNYVFFAQLLEIINQTKVAKIIGLGSQAEYGSFNGAVNEDYPLNPNTAYGAAKVKVSALLKSYAEKNKVDWYWTRLFSIYGPKEDANWLIPATIKNLIEQSEMPLTACEQSYDYLFVKDFVEGIRKVADCKQNLSGTYNLSSNKSLKIKEILSFLENKLAAGKKLLLFGALPYRDNQVMHMQGNSGKFYRTFDFSPEHNMENGLNKTIEYYLNNVKENGSAN
ncbi:MAG TPA: NAD(P)-dependent oxidoreductase [Paludibacter sp.]|nr:NAD(P)-dependent oxidoreductase [Paludibacter sp.]